MKRKKRYEQQLEQLQGTLTTIETQREALENANTNAAVLDTMKGASDALKKSHKDMDIDKVHDMMDDIAEQNDIANEISNAISTGIVSPNAVDEDELARELEELEQEGLDQELLNVGPTPTAKLPEVPSTDLPTAAKDKEKKKGKIYLEIFFVWNFLNFSIFLQLNLLRKRTLTILIWKNLCNGLTKSLREDLKN